MPSLPSAPARRAPVLALLALVPVLAGCGTKTVPGDTVSSTLRPQLEQRGIRITELACQELDAEVGATTTCEATAGGETRQLTVRANAVDGDRVAYAVTRAE